MLTENSVGRCRDCIFAGQWADQSDAVGVFSHRSSSLYSFKYSADMAPTIGNPHLLSAPSNTPLALTTTIDFQKQLNGSSGDCSREISKIQNYRCIFCSAFVCF